MHKIALYLLTCIMMIYIYTVSRIKRDQHVFVISPTKLKRY